MDVNMVAAQTCPVAHAQMMGYILPQKRRSNHRIKTSGRRFALVTSAQPCCPSYGAAVWTSIDEPLIGARAGNMESFSRLDEGHLPADWTGKLDRHGITMRRDTLRKKARCVLTAFGYVGIRQ